MVARALIAFAALFGATLAHAQAQFNRITDFGDSFADTGSAPGGAFRLGGVPCPPASPPCRFTGSTNFVDTLQSIYGLPTATNYAIGGARTDNTNSITALTLPGFTYELQQFAASGTRFSERDLVVLSIGGNDLSAINITGAPDPVAVITASATNSAATALAGVQQLVAAGATNIAWLSPGNTKYFPQPPDGPAAFNDAQRDAFARTYFQQIQRSLVPLAASGVRIFLFDFETLQARIAANPGQYGFTGLYGPATPVGNRCEYNLGDLGCFYDNSVHPTGTAMALIATYMANQIDAPTTVVPQGGVATGLAAGFSTSVFGRLDAERAFQPFATGTAIAMSYAMPTKAPIEPFAPKPTFAPKPAEKRWSIHGGVNYASGSRNGEFLAAGYDYNAVGGTVGVEYRPDRAWRVGGVFAYSEPSVSLGIQNAHNHVNAYQLAAYGSFTDADWFADALLAYGRQDFALDRQGVSDIIRGSTRANTFTAAARGGYLVDFGAVRAGPIAGLDYTHAVIDGYTENGDILLTMTVDRQALDALTGSAGLQVRYPFLMGKAVYNPFVNVTAEHDFLGSGRVVTTTQVTAPLLPVLTPVPDTGSRTYGKVAAGIATAVAGNLSATLSAATSFAREGGNDFGVSGGIKAAF